MGLEVGSGTFYSFSLEIAIKGLEIELVKVYTMLTSIDLSNTKFQGEIPKVIGKFNSLKGLNLSHNNLSGCIPTSIGTMTNLEWLDLSSNKLVGTIPETLLDLTFLSFLNLSKNELVGCIPRGRQFNTFENNSYQGNEGLRGFPLSRDCSKNEPPQQSHSNLPDEDGSKSIFAFGWKVVLIGYGCGVVFGLAIGYVVFQTINGSDVSRHSCIFQNKATILVLENMKQKIVIQVSMHCDKCRTKALKIAAAADGVASVALHGPEKDKLMIVGDGVDAACLTSSLRKKLSHASLETVEEVKDKKVEDQKKM
ncbi:hypothetical protein CRYUN_Cryun41cG0055900 [Craigia yunnanensis]